MTTVSAQNHDVRIGALATDGELRSVRRPSETAPSRRLRISGTRAVASRRAAADECCRCRVRARDRRRADPSGVNAIEPVWVSGASSSRDPQRGVMSFRCGRTAVLRPQGRHHREKLAVWRPVDVTDAQCGREPLDGSTAGAHSEDWTTLEREPVTIRRAGGHGGESKSVSCCARPPFASIRQMF